MGAGLFWGLILIVIGLSIIFRIFFDINVFRIVIAIVFILIGIKILIGRPVFHSTESENDVFFGEKMISSMPEDGMTYNTIFGKTIYDFRDINMVDQDTRISVSTVFGSTDILLPPSVPVKIKADAAFAEAKMPNNNTVAFGSITYVSDNVTDTTLVLQIDAHVVFGALVIKQ